MRTSLFFVTTTAALAVLSGPLPALADYYYCSSNCQAPPNFQPVPNGSRSNSQPEIRNQVWGDGGARVVPERTTVVIGGGTVTTITNGYPPVIQTQSVYYPSDPYGVYYTNPYPLPVYRYRPSRGGIQIRIR